MTQHVDPAYLVPAFDFTKPFMTRDGRKAKLFGRDENYIAVDIIGLDGKIERVFRYADTGRVSPGLADDTGDLINLVEDTAYTRRSLRPGLRYRFRGGDTCHVTLSDFGETVRAAWSTSDGKPAESWIDKTGRVSPNGADHPDDVVEITDQVTKWVRIYDTPTVNEKGKIVVSGKEFAAERALHWYLYDTEVEARSQLRGVRAVISITYREGEGLA